MSWSNTGRRRSPRFEQVPLESIFVISDRKVPKKVLNVSADLSLLETRRAILERGGYLVSCASNAVDVVQLCRNETFDVVVVGHSLPKRQKHAVIQAVRKYNPAARIIGLYRISAAETAGADLAIDSHDDPEILVQVVRQDPLNAVLHSDL